MASKVLSLSPAQCPSQISFFGQVLSGSSFPPYFADPLDEEVDELAELLGTATITGDVHGGDTGVIPEPKVLDLARVRDGEE
jgi:hypothetical protein